jgi:DNA-binding transcriptional MocR family regulator
LTHYAVNAYIVLVTNWVPQIASRAGPIYEAIADDLAEAIANGRLRAGERLPTHRNLAQRLGVTIGTVTRAYAEAERRGVVEATVGRGTFVKWPRASMSETRETASEIVDLRSNYPALGASAVALSEALGALSKDPSLATLLRYQEHAGLLRHRSAGAQLISRPGFDVQPERVLVTAGGQHAMLIALLALTQPGDLVLTEELTYHGFKALAQRLKLRLHGLALDDEGLVPEAFETACRTLTPRALYCTPTLQNPTAVIMSEERRHRIGEIAARFGVTIIEDDIFGFLVPGRRPLAAFAEGKCCYISSVSKSLAPGLRIGFVAVPQGETPRYAEAIRMTTWMAPPLIAEIVCRWIEDGTAERLMEAQRAENAARIRIASEHLHRFVTPTHSSAYHLWMKLPAPWRADRFQQEALTAGVALTTGEAFAVGVQPPEAVRVCVGAAATRELLGQALSKVARLAASTEAASEPALSIV